MKFIVDAQLPRRLARALVEALLKHDFVELTRDAICIHD
jgi:predicted nuclease of predicted toxin-antitoxin system